MKILKVSVMPFGKKRQLEGCIFGKWTVIALAGSIRDKAGAMRRKWLCRCQCGKERMINTGTLVSGKSNGCGCSKVRHGHTVKQKPSPEYVSWASMKQRCLNKNGKRYGDYGGRGITICEKWQKSFDSFLEDMGPKPSLDHSLDRIDNNGNYEPGNCRWATRSQQQANKRRMFIPEPPRGGDHWTRKERQRAASIGRKNIKNAHHSGEANNNAKITLEIAQKIRKFAGDNPTLRMDQIGARFGIKREQTRKIIKGIVWLK